jgi:Amt family ammonium transporter
MDMDLLWTVLVAFGALLVRAGMAVHACGMTRSKNSAGILMRHVVDLAVTLLAFWLIGSMVLTATRERWLNWSVVVHGGVEGSAGLLFAMCVTTIATGIVVGVVGERSRFFPMLASPILLGGIIVPLAMRWVARDGWLGQFGFRDLGRASAVHLGGAVFAAVVAVLVGARTGKYNRDGSSNAIPGHSVPVATIGMMVILIGWPVHLVGFGAGAGAAMNVLLAAAGAVVVSVIVSQMRYGKSDIHLTLLAMLGALVASGAAADVRWRPAAVLIGVVAGLVVPTVMFVIDLGWRVDDLTGGVAAHGVGAVVGLVFAAIFARVESVGEKFRVIGVQVLGIVVVVVLSAVVAGVAYGALKRAVGLRSKEADEYDGLDLAEHDIGAYPDFQQTMIKSYHLREA